MENGFKKDDLIKLKGFDRAIIGIGFQADQNILENDHVVYDSEKIIEILKEEQNLTDEEANEYFEYNILGAHMGDNTPLIIDTSVKAKIDALNKPL